MWEPPSILHVPGHDWVTQAHSPSAQVLKLRRRSVTLGSASINEISDNKGSWCLNFPLEGKECLQRSYISLKSQKKYQKGTFILMIFLYNAFDFQSLDKIQSFWIWHPFWCIWKIAPHLQENDFTFKCVIYFLKSNTFLVFAFIDI